MGTKLMPIERLATIVADATTRAATNVTGIFRNERMTWTEQGVHAAAWDAVRHDPEVQNALRMVEVDGAADYASMHAGGPTPQPAGIEADVAMVMLAAGRSGSTGAIVESLRRAWMSMAFSGPSEKFDHERAFDRTIARLSLPGPHGE